MTPRDRILAALDHEPPDRTPLDGWFHPEVMELLKSHFQTDDWSVVEERLGMDGWIDLSPSIQFDDFETRAGSRPGSAAGPVAIGPVAIWLDDNTYEDSWGVRFRLGAGDRYRQWVGGPLQLAETDDDLHRYSFPTTANVREPDNYALRVAQSKSRGQFVTGEIENPYKRFWHLRGYENALVDYLVNQEMLDAVYDRLFAIAAELAVRMAWAGVDMIKVVGDVAMNDRIIMGPDAWRRFDKPRFAKLIEDCRSINKDVAFFFHSDGKLTDLVGDLIDVGFTVINPIQPECMDPVEVKRRWGDRITLHGGISIQRTLPFGTVADVRREVEHLIRNCGWNGGLILMPSNVIQPDSPIENILACYDTARNLSL